jgi:hypothetical protein
VERLFLSRLALKIMPWTSIKAVTYTPPPQFLDQSKYFYSLAPASTFRRTRH